MRINLKTFLRVVGIISMVLVIGFSLAACGGGGDGGPGGGWPGDGDDSGIPGGGGGGGSTGGVLTVTGIPSEYNGKWASAGGNKSSTSFLNFIGCQSVEPTTSSYTVTAVQIANGSVSIPLWVLSTNTRYTGNETMYEVNISIINTSTFILNSSSPPFARRLFSNIAFSNGSASLTWSQGH